MHNTNASFAVGLNCPVSIELIVFLETPTSFANSACDSPFSFLASGRLLCRISPPSTSDHPAQLKNPYDQHRQRKYAPEDRSDKLMLSPQPQVLDKKNDEGHGKKGEIRASVDVVKYESLRKFSLHFLQSGKRHAF